MKFNKESNSFVIIFATIIVVVCGGLLAYVFTALKPIQDENIKKEKMQYILQASGDEELRDIERDNSITEFKKYIVKRILLDYNGNVKYEKSNIEAIDSKDNTDAFNMDLRKNYSKFISIIKKYPNNREKINEELKKENIYFPLFVFEKNGVKSFIGHVTGKGLWDDIWGYFSIGSDGKTILSSVFDHKGETPGLGSKITEDNFELSLKNKLIASENGKYTPVKILKSSNKITNVKSEIHGIAGATFTGNGVAEMLNIGIEVYKLYFDKTLSQNNVKNTPIIDTITNNIDSNNISIDSSQFKANKKS